MPENGLFKALSKTIERPHGKLSDGSGLHKALKETTWKDCFISVGLHEDHKKTLQKDCFIAAGLRRDHKKTTKRLFYIHWSSQRP